MSKAWHVGRVALIVVGAVAVVGIALRVGAGWYLQSAGGRAVVAERLGEAIGLPVEVRELNVGPVSSTIAFRVLDPALPNSPEAEVLAVESASADVSFSELLTGRVRPKEVVLRGVSVTLRLDAAGKLLTTLPTLPESQAPADGPLPQVIVERATVTIRQEGRPAFRVSGVSLQAGTDGGKVVLSGVADDPAWSKWKLSGEVDRGSETGWADLAADEAPLTLELLRSLPFVPPEVWDNAQPAGRGKATVHLSIGAAPARAVGYDIRVQPSTASLALPAAEVTIQDVQGVLSVRDGKLTVGGADGRPQATAKLAGGVVKVAAKYDFAPEPSVADPISVEVERLAVKELPAKWGLKNLGGGLPGKLSLESGFLTGSAKLKLVVPAAGDAQVYGGGSGTIALPNFLGGKGRIGVTLGGDGKRLNFNLGETTVGAADERADRRQAAGVAPVTRRLTAVGSPTADLERLLLAATLLQPPPKRRRPNPRRGHAVAARHRHRATRRAAGTQNPLQARRQGHAPGQARRAARRGQHGRVVQAVRHAHVAGVAVRGADGAGRRGRPALPERRPHAVRAARQGAAPRRRPRRVPRRRQSGHRPRRRRHRQAHAHAPAGRPRPRRAARPRHHRRRRRHRRGRVQSPLREAARPRHLGRVGKAHERRTHPRRPHRQGRVVRREDRQGRPHAHRRRRHRRGHPRHRRGHAGPHGRAQARRHGEGRRRQRHRPAEARPRAEAARARRRHADRRRPPHRHAVAAGAKRLGPHHRVRPDAEQDGREPPRRALAARPRPRPRHAADGPSVRRHCRRQARLPAQARARRLVRPRLQGVRRGPGPRVRAGLPRPRQRRRHRQGGRHHPAGEGRRPRRHPRRGPDRPEADGAGLPRGEAGGQGGGPRRGRSSTRWKGTASAARSR